MSCTLKNPWQFTYKHIPPWPPCAFASPFLASADLVLMAPERTVFRVTERKAVTTKSVQTLANHAILVQGSMDAVSFVVPCLFINDIYCFYTYGIYLCYLMIYTLLCLCPKMIHVPCWFPWISKDSDSAPPRAAVSASLWSEARRVSWGGCLIRGQHLCCLDERWWELKIVFGCVFWDVFFEMCFLRCVLKMCSVFSLFFLCLVTIESSGAVYSSCCQPGIDCTTTSRYRYCRWHTIRVTS